MDLMHTKPSQNLNALKQYFANTKTNDLKIQSRTIHIPIIHSDANRHKTLCSKEYFLSECILQLLIISLYIQSQRSTISLTNDNKIGCIIIRQISIHGFSRVMI